MFQDYFLLHFLFNFLRLLFVWSFGSMFQDFSSFSQHFPSIRTAIQDFEGVPIEARFEPT